MFWLNTRRIFKVGIISSWRNRWVSLATVLVLCVALFVFGSLIFLNVILASALGDLEKKVDISIYFKIDASERDVLALQDAVDTLPEVRETEYISREENFKQFTERHRDNPFIQESLEELGDNPLGAVLHVRANEVSQYERVSQFLESSPFAASIIDNINFRQNKVVIERLYEILKLSRRVGLVVTLTLVLMAVLVTFNTIRLAIYANREEIRIMKLVGARRRFIRGPYLVEGALYGIFSAIIVVALFYPILAGVGNRLERFFGGTNIFDYYASNWWQVLLILMIAGVLLGVISSSIAVKRYLKEV